MQLVTRQVSILVADEHLHIIFLGQLSEKPFLTALLGWNVGYVTGELNSKSTPSRIDLSLTITIKTQ